MLMKFGNQKGFTLLELLVVMSIVGVLAMVAVPRFTGAVALANTSKIQADLNVLNSAIVLYEAEHGSYPKNLTTDMKDYIQDAENLKPPKGKCLLRDGTTVEITETGYTLSDDKSQALCQSRAITEFGRKDK